MTLDDTRTLAALRQLDPAPRDPDGSPTSLTAAESAAATATLARVLATDPQAAAAHHRPRPATGRRRHRTRWVLAGLVTAAAVALPVLTNGGDQAYASWSPLPVALTPADGAAAARACLADLGQQTGAPVTPLLAERRGRWTYVLVRPGPEAQTSCLMPTAEITDDPGPGRRRWFGSSDAEVSPPASEPDEVRVDTTAVGSTKEGLFSFSEGAVGRDVVGLTFTTPRGVTVQASLANGRFAVWWPAGRNDIRSPEISEASDIDVTLADGTTYRLPR